MKHRAFERVLILHNPHLSRPKKGSLGDSYGLSNEVLHPVQAEVKFVQLSARRALRIPFPIKSQPEARALAKSPPLRNRPRQAAEREEERCQRVHTNS
jgi:hypothetical protein